MRRESRGIDIPSGTLGQEVAVIRCFQDFMKEAGLDTATLDKMHGDATSSSASSPQNLYSLLTAFSIYLRTKKSTRSRGADGLLSRATAVGYLSQVVNLLRERYPNALLDAKRIAKIRENMANSINPCVTKVVTYDISKNKSHNLRLPMLPTLVICM